jgi:hypothetical protein
VTNLDEHPSACIRYDRHAVYLGRPGPQPDCPARVVGRTEAVHVQPLRDATASRPVLPGDKLGSFTVRPTVGHVTRLALPEAGVSITGVYGTDPAALQRVLRGTRLTSHWTGGPAKHPAKEPAHSQAPSSAPAVSRSARTGIPERLDYASGKGFDTCTAPSLATMKAWRSSFDVTNIYIGGAARGCAQPNLTASWVKKVHKMGYRITPTYVGLQPPCGTRPQKFTKKNAASEGKKAGTDAVARAKALGVPSKKPIYLDVEAYKSKNGSCKAAVLRFVNAWVKRVKNKHYKPCLYGSASSAIRDVGAAKGIAKPVGIWFANWNGKARVYGDKFLPDHWWPPHRRIKQYRGAHKERHGGVTLNIDTSVADGRAY